MNTYEHILKMMRDADRILGPLRDFERQIAATDQQIDRLVYDLYGLTEEEIKIVEEQTK